MIAINVLVCLSIQLLVVTCVNSVGHDGKPGDCRNDLNKLHSNCSLSFRGYDMHIYMQLFRCSHPTELMVVTQVDSLNVDHARVFANDEECTPLEGYDGVFIHVKIHPIHQDMIWVKVSYYIFDRLEAVAYDHNITLHTEDCPLQSADQKLLSPFAITIITALTFVILAGMISFVVLYHLHKRRATRQSKLIGHMETTAMTNPYQVGPSEASLRVEYRIRMESKRTSKKDEVFTNPSVLQSTHPCQHIELSKPHAAPVAITTQPVTQSCMSTKHVTRL